MRISLPSDDNYENIKKIQGLLDKKEIKAVELQTSLKSLEKELNAYARQRHHPSLLYSSHKINLHQHLTLRVLGELAAIITSGNTEDQAKKRALNLFNNIINTIKKSPDAKPFNINQTIDWINKSTLGESLQEPLTTAKHSLKEASDRVEDIVKWYGDSKKRKYADFTTFAFHGYNYHGKFHRTIWDKLLYKISPFHKHSQTKINLMRITKSTAKVMDYLSAKECEQINSMMGEHVGENRIEHLNSLIAECLIDRQANLYYDLQEDINDFINILFDKIKKGDKPYPKDQFVQYCHNKIKSAIATDSDSKDEEKQVELQDNFPKSVIDYDLNIFTQYLKEKKGQYDTHLKGLKKALRDFERVNNLPFLVHKTDKLQQLQIDDGNTLLQPLYTKINNGLIIVHPQGEIASKNFNLSAASVSSYMLCAGEGGVAGVGAGMAGIYVGTVCGFSGAITNQVLVEKDSYEVIKLMRKGLTKDPDIKKMPTWKKALLLFALFLAMTSGICYGALSTYAVHNNIISPSLAKIGHGVTLGVLAIIISLCPIAAVVIAMASLLFTAVLGLIKTDGSKAWQALKERFTFPWSQMTGEQRFLRILDISGFIMNCIFSIVITVAIGMMSYALFGTDVSQLFCSVFHHISYATASLLGKIFSIGNTTINVPFNLIKNSSVIRNLSALTVTLVLTPFVLVPIIVTRLLYYFSFKRDITFRATKATEKFLLQNIMISAVNWVRGAWTDKTMTRSIDTLKLKQKERKKQLIETSSTDSDTDRNSDDSSESKVQIAKVIKQTSDPVENSRFNCVILQAIGGQLAIAGNTVGQGLVFQKAGHDFILQVFKLDTGMLAAVIQGTNSAASNSSAMTKTILYKCHVIIRPQAANRQKSAANQHRLFHPNTGAITTDTDSTDSNTSSRASTPTPAGNE